MLEALELALREKYIEAIQQIQPLDSTEAKDIKETLGWLKTAAAVHKPFNMEQHLGVISLILSPNRKATFLLNHKKAQFWLPPGGHVDKGLSFQEAVRIEVKEEIGYEAVFISTKPIFLTKVLTRGLNAGHIDVTVWFLVEGDPNLKYHVFAKEAEESGWVDIDELAKMPDYSNLPRLYSKILLMQKQGKM